MSHHPGKLSGSDRSSGPSDAETDGHVDRLTNIARSLRADANAIQAALSVAERRFQATFLHAPVGIAHVALDGSFLMVNPCFEEITGYRADVLMRTGFQAITHPDDLDADITLLARLNIGEIQRYTMEKRYIRPDGTLIWINLTVAMVRDDAGSPDFYVAVVEDMSAIRQAHFDALHDSLTGLLNRRGFFADSVAALERAVSAGLPISLLYLDLDGFKRLNDRFGHRAGDRCLADVAALITTMLQPGDLGARIGGDEFVLLLADRSGIDALGMGERLRRALTALGGKSEGVTGSLGLVTRVPMSPAELDTLMAQADDAMLTAKRSGKNQIVVATAG